jgi:hypothetical protein
VVDVELELGAREMGWDFLVRTASGVGIEDIEEWVGRWLVHNAVLILVLVGVLVTLEPVLVATAFVLEL